MEHAHPREVPRPALRDRCGGVRARRDARHHDRPAAGEGAGRTVRSRRSVRPGARCGDGRHGRAARDRRGCRRATRRQQRQPLAGLVHHRQRQSARRLHRQRQRRDAGPCAGRAALPHDRRPRGAQDALLPPRARHDASEPVAACRRRAPGGGNRRSPGPHELPAVAGAPGRQLPVPQLLRRRRGSRGFLGRWPDTRRQGRVQLPRRSDHVGAHATADPARSAVVRHRPEAECRRQGRGSGEGQAQQEVRPTGQPARRILSGCV